MQVGKPGEALVVLDLNPSDLSLLENGLELEGWTSISRGEGPRLPTSALKLDHPAGCGWFERSFVTSSSHRIERRFSARISGDEIPEHLPAGAREIWLEQQRSLADSRLSAASGQPWQSLGVESELTRRDREQTLIRLRPARYLHDEAVVEIDLRATLELGLVCEVGGDVPSFDSGSDRGPLADPAFTIQALEVDRVEGLLRIPWGQLSSDFAWVDPPADGIQVWEGNTQVAIDVVSGSHIDLWVRPLLGEAVVDEFRRGDWTDRRVYRFLVADSRSSLRMDLRSVAPGSAPRLDAPRRTIRLRDEQACVKLNGHVPRADDEIIHWLETAWDPFVAGEHITPSVLLEGIDDLEIDSLDPVRFKIRLQGINGVAGIDPEHEHRYVLEDIAGTEIVAVTSPDYAFSGVAFREHSLELMPADIAASDGRLYIETTDATSRCDGPCPSFYWDYSYVDWIEIDYPQRLVERNDRLDLQPEVDGRWAIRLFGFESDQLEGWDLSDPTRPVRLVDAFISLHTKWWIDFETDLGRGSRILWLQSGGYLSLADAGTLRPFESSSWIQGPVSGADWIAIGPRSLIDSSALLSLEAQRQAQGWRTARIALEELYDEVSFGRPTPWAIHSLMSTAWVDWPKPAPSFLLLVGDASTDVKDQLRICTGCSDAIGGNEVYSSWPHPGDMATPTFLRVSPSAPSTWLGYYADDTFFGRVAGVDLVADIQVGRLPVRSVVELQAAVDRIIAVEALDPTAPGSKRIEYVVGSRDATELTAVMDSVRTVITAPWEQGQLYFGGTPWNGADLDAENGNGVSDIVDRMNDGRLAVQWIGHGGFTALQGTTVGGAGLKGSLLDLGHLDRSELVVDLPVLAAGSCNINGYHLFSVEPTLGEALMSAADGGVAGVLSHSTTSFASGAAALSRGVQKALEDPVRPPLLGELLDAAQAESLVLGLDSELESLVLIGDPATILPLPRPAAPTGLQVSAAGCRELGLSWTSTPGSASTRVYRGRLGFWSQIDQVVGNSLIDSDLTPGVDFDYRVSSFDVDGFESSVSETVTAIVARTRGDVDCDCEAQATDIAAQILAVKDFWFLVLPCATTDVDGDGTADTGDLLEVVASIFE